MRSATELAIQRRLTKSFIDRDPVDIELAGQTKQSDSSGGQRLVDQPQRPAVRVTLIEPSDSGARDPFSFAQGTSGAIEYQLVAETGTDVREDDRFTLAGHLYAIVRLLPDNGYEVRALVNRVS